jgi:hypothetical protein
MTLVTQQIAQAAGVAVRIDPAAPFSEAVLGREL